MALVENGYDDILKFHMPEHADFDAIWNTAYDPAWTLYLYLYYVVIMSPLQS